MSKVVELADYRPHRVFRETCNACGHRCIGVAPVTADMATLECMRCGERDSSVEDVDT